MFDRPFSEHIANDRWLAEIRRLREKLKTDHGITDVKAGMELDFILLPKNSKMVNEHSGARKKEFIAEVEAQIARSHDEGEKEKLRAKATEMQAFSPVEVLLYELMEKNPATRDIMEHTFGRTNTREHCGYYDDHPPRIEARIKYVSAEELCRNHAAFRKELAQGMQEYGLDFSYASPPMPHVSFSFWKGGNNVLELRSDEHMTTGATITEGVTRACYDGFMLCDMSGRNHNDSVAALPECSACLRLSDGRLEVRPRPDHFNISYHTEAILTTVLAGALHGLDAHKTGKGLAGLIPAQANTRLIYDRPDTTYKRLVDFLNTGRVQAGKNSLQRDDFYLTLHLPQVCGELGMVKKDTQEYKDLMADAAIFYHTGACSERLQGLYDEFVKKLDGYVADIQAGKSDVTFRGNFKSFEIGHEHYLLGGGPDSGIQTRREAYRLATSAALRDTLSPDLFHDLTTEARKIFGEPGYTEKVAVDRLNGAITKAASSLRGMPPQK